SSSAILESDRYARNRQGNDPGEVRSIKEYAPGDPVKNIHWKLSEKTDKVLVKELSLPVTDDLLLILDTGAGEKQSFEAMDACAVVYGSMIGSLLREGMDFSIGWTDPAEGGVLVTRKILSEKDAAAAADEYLAVPVSDGETFPILENVMQNSRFAHLAIVGSTVPPGIAGMASGCQVSALVCGYSGSMSSEGIRIIGFPEAGYETDLAVVEI
ncbi:MAG: DUF58 domain-containing protein, partial [Bacillota bacterium]|nr:DUF58 domain-containing protein [Bacillota bacterium]